MNTVIASIDSLADRMAAQIGRCAAAALAATSTRWTMAVPGGSVGDQLFPRLVSLPIDWTRVDVFWGDERAVPPDDEASNFGQAHRLWLRHLAAPPVVHRVDADNGDVGRAAKRYAAALTSLAGTPPALDLAILGVGPDGHVCSLFPGDASGERDGQWTAGVEHSPKPPARRVTLTYAALARTRAIWVAAFGGSKADVVGEALADPASTLPVARVMWSGPAVTVWLDPAAAGR